MKLLDAKDLKILKYPHPILRAKAEPVDRITEDIFRLAEAMKELMMKHDGVGLAANQVGVAKQIFVLNTTPYSEEPDIIVCVNPVIISREGACTDEEGCLSFPELRLNIERPQLVRVQLQTLFNETIILEAKEILARAVCHETEHLQGIVFIDHASPEERHKVDKYLQVNPNPETA